jgi:hypothetical protein
MTFVVMAFGHLALAKMTIGRRAFVVITFGQISSNRSNILSNDIFVMTFVHLALAETTTDEVPIGHKDVK